MTAFDVVGSPCPFLCSFAKLKMEYIIHATGSIVDKCLFSPSRTIYSFAVFSFTNSVFANATTF